MAKLLIEKKLEDNIYKLEVSMFGLTPAENVLIQTYGEPKNTFGGTFDPNSGAFLTRYFPDSQYLVQDWTQFQVYATGDEVQYTDEIYYRTLQTVDFPFSDWTQFQSEAPLWDAATSYSLGDVVYYQPSAKFYVADAVTTGGASPSENPVDFPNLWSETEVVVKYTDNKYYKALKQIDFTNIASWVTGQQYSAGDYVLFTDSNYYKATIDSPLTWGTSTQYAIGDIVWYNSNFYAALSEPLLGTYVTMALSAVTGTSGVEFVAGDTVSNTASPAATGTVVSWSSITSELVLDVTSGGFSPSDSISVTAGSGDGTATVDSVTNSDPQTNTAQWTTTVLADPVSDGGTYWQIHRDFEPINDGGEYWEVYTDRDPGISGSSYWVAFIPTGADPSTTASWAVNQITLALPSGVTPSFVFEFDGDLLQDAEQRADDFAVIITKDVQDVWTEFIAQSDEFTDAELTVLSNLTC